MGIRGTLTEWVNGGSTLQYVAGLAVKVGVEAGLGLVFGAGGALLLIELTSLSQVASLIGGGGQVAVALAAAAVVWYKLTLCTYLPILDDRAP